MFERETRIYAFMFDYCKLLVDDILPEQMSHQSESGGNPPVWILGHLTIAADFGFDLLGHGRQLSEIWYENFAPGSVPLQNRVPYPSKDELMAALEDGHHRLTEAALGAAQEVVAKANPYESIRPGLPTIGDMITHLLTSHEGIHLGQLSSWRRQMGLPAASYLGI